MQRSVKRPVVFLSENRWERARGGAELQMHLQKHFLRQRGLKVHHISLHNRSQNLEIKRTNRLINFLFGPLRLQYSLIIFILLIRIRPYLIIHRDSSSFGLPGLLYCLIMKKKFILQTAHDKDFEITFSFFRPRQSAENLIKKWLLSYSSEIIVQTNDQLKKCQHISKQKLVHVMKNAVVLSEIRTRPLNPREICIIWVANIKPDKNLQKFIELARHFTEQHEFRFIVVGKCYGDKNSEKMLLEIANTANMTYLGEVSQAQVLKEIEESDFLCNTSLKEGFPNTFLQAWSLGKPVISTHVDPDNVIRRFGLGIVNEDISKIKSLILDVVNDDNMYRDLSVSSLLYVQQHHALKNYQILLNICHGANASAL